jgi:hypothetical protein
MFDWLSVRTRGRNGGLRVAGFVGLGLLSVPPAAALECPANQPLTRPGVLQETAAQKADLTKLLATGDTDNRVRVILSDLRTRYPTVENAELINYLAVAYCPVVAQLSGLGEQEKQARMDQFVGQVVRLTE